MGYRLTANGGHRLASSTKLENIALELTARPDGPRHVRDMHDPQIVASFDIQRGTVHVTSHGVHMADPPAWVAQLRRLVAITYPNMKDNAT